MTPQGNKPTSLREILHNFGVTYSVLIKEERIRDIDAAISAIAAVYESAVPEKHIQFPNYKWDEFDDGFNYAIDQIHANFKQIRERNNE